MPVRHSPPWIPEALLWLALRRADWRDTVIGDLREEYADRRRQGRRADLWYWREAVSLLAGGARTLGLGGGHRVLRPSKERSRPMRDVLPDIALALRLVRRQPGFSATIVVMLALGLSSTAVIFNVLDALVVRVMDLPTPERLIVIGEATPTTPPEDRRAAPANYLDWRDTLTTVDFIGALDLNEANLASPGSGDVPERATVTSVSAGLLEALGTTPQLGRFVDAGDEPPGRPAVAILSDGLWRRRFGADPGVIGRTILLDERPHLVVGVAGPRFTYPYDTGLWVALSMSPQERLNRDADYLTVVARLREDRTLEQARAELDMVSRHLQQAYPKSNASVSAVALPMRMAIRDEGAPAMVAAWQAAAVIVLLIACANCAQLLLVRGAARRREFTLRTALGAGLGRLVRQLVTEGLALSALAGLLSLGLTAVALRVMKSWMPEELVRYVYGWQWIGLNGRLVLFVVALSALVAVVFSLLPALHAARVDLTDALREGGRTASSGLNVRQRGLVIAEIGCAVVLTTATVLCVSGAARLLYGPPGYDATHLLTANVALPQGAYPTPEARQQFQARALDRLAALPLVSHRAVVNVMPASNANTSRPIEVEGIAISDASDRPRADYRVVSAEYFETLRIPLLRGRPLLASDGPASLPVAVVSQSFVSRYWPDRDPVGRRFRTDPQGPWITVVGVSGDILHHWFNRRYYPTFYRPFTQDPRAITGVVIRSPADETSLAAALRSAFVELDPNLAVYDIRSAEHLRETNTTGLMFLVRVMTVLGILAIVMACAGLHAVMSYSLASRRREYGVRCALGAAPSALVHLAGRDVARLTALGLAIGLPGALAVGRLLSSTLFGIVAFDVTSLVATAAGLAAVTMTAGLLPVRQALRLDLVRTLREE